MKRIVALMCILPLSILFGACDDGGGGVDGCDPVCEASGCMVCDLSGDTPTCMSACSDGLTCEAGQCVAPETSTCDPVCGACQACDTAGVDPVCVDMCAPGLECNAGRCEAPPAPSCEPACSACQTCDLSGDTPVCVDNCAAGLECVDGVCQAPAGPACEPACGECQVCDLSGDAPVCVDLCGAEELCDAGVCRRDGLHAHLEALQGDFAAATDVTAACLACHPQQGADMVQSAHFKWRGATPGMAGTNGDVGKANLINNFCIAVPSNEKRCTQCHAGYGWGDAANFPDFSLDDPAYVDCLVCHADPASGYSKDPKTAGVPPATVNLGVAARSVGSPNRTNCGKCHFGAGGGDNVKKGDLGSAMANPAPEADVHMGANMTCAACHRGDNHTLLGQGVHLPVSEGRVGCADCHTATPHGNSNLDNHAIDIACQTCHIPAFSRQQPTKMDWDWSTAGNKTRGTDGLETTTLADGTVVTAYDFMKGDFVWEKNVKPVYAWHNGSVARMTILDNHGGQGASAADPVKLGMPTATFADADAKIFPFKVMTGRQPGHLSADYMIVPKLFGPGGFWGGIPAAADYTEQGVRDLWTSALTAGAIVSGQILDTDSIADGDWGWVYTDLYLGINHEVAPKEQALGANGTCNACHSGGMDFQALGYACEDPMSGGCSRN